MISKKISILITILSYVLFSSCENKMPVNGKLEGMWQVMSIEHEGVFTDLKDQKVYWSFQLNLVQLSSSLNGYTRMYARFIRDKNELDFYDFVYNSENALESDNNEWVSPENSSVLNRWAIYSDSDPNNNGRIKIKYTIKTINDSFLIVENAHDTILLRKF